LPEWYVLIEREAIINKITLITNDFISRMDLYPWLTALVVNEDRRGENLSRLLIEHIIAQAKEKGFKCLYLATDHQGFYENDRFYAMGLGYHRWGETSQIYKRTL
jgi:N-acetylglutamate synthase-like GNAT family acetyltransferase